MVRLGKKSVDMRPKAVIVADMEANMTTTTPEMNAIVRTLEASRPLEGCRRLLFARANEGGIRVVKSAVEVANVVEVWIFADDTAREMEREAIRVMQWAE